MAQSGERIGPFELVRRLESSSGLELWLAARADDNATAEQTVWMRLVGDLSDVDAARGLRREYEALRRVEDARIPAVVGYYAGQGALALGWSQGVGLDQVLDGVRRGWLPWDAATALDIALEVAHALRAAHSILRDQGERITHLGLCPQRVLLTAQGGVCVLGVGALHTDLDPAWWTPERVEGQHEGVEADQWQLGALLYELLALEPLLDGGPGRGARVESQLAALERSHPAAVRILRRALAASPIDRYRAERELLKALHGLARELGGSSQRHELHAKLAPRLLELTQDTEDEGLVDPAAPREVKPELRQVLEPLPAGPESTFDEALSPLPAAPLASLEKAPLPTLVPPSDTLEVGQPEARTEPLPDALADDADDKGRYHVGEWTAGLALLLFVLSIFYYAWQKL